MKKIKFIFIFLFVFLLYSCSDKQDKIIPIYEGIEIIYDNKLNTQASYEDELIIEAIDLDYYVYPASNMEVVIHIYNPSQYEILSFTINDIKYQSYEFKEGSNSNTIIIDILSPENGGVYNYTIDKIKYIDETTIKDVDMSMGNKTINFGVTYDNDPIITYIEEDISYDSYSLFTVVKDDYNIINPLIGVRAYLFDENDNYIKYVKIQDGRAILDDLNYGTNYKCRILTVYDKLDGSGYKTVKLYEKEFVTLSPIDIDYTKIGYDNITFEINKQYNDINIDSIELIDNDKREVINSNSINSLISNHSYSLEVSYTYNNKNYKYVDTFKTLEYDDPRIEYFNVIIDKNNVTFENQTTGQIITNKYVNIYSNLELVLTTNIDNNVALLTNKNYTFELVCEYDKQDGFGIKQIKKEINKDINILATPQININYSIENDTLSGELIAIDYDDTLISYDLYLCDINKTVIEVIDDLSNITGLSRNTNYYIRCDYLYNLGDGNNIRDSYYLSFTTSKVIPSLEFRPFLITENLAKLDIFEHDPNVIGEIKSIRLYSKEGYYLAETAVSNSVTFDNLSYNTDYVVKVIYIYDMDDKEGTKEIEYNYAIKTAKRMPTASLELIEGYDFITINPTIIDNDETVLDYEVNIFRNDILVYSGKDLTINKLLSNTLYKVVYKLKYNLNDLTLDKELDNTDYITTLSKTTPTIKLNKEKIDYSSIKLDYQLSDENQIFSFNKIEVIHNGNVISELSLDNIYIDNLYSNNEYIFKVYYSYDLNTGYGSINEYCEYSFNTLKRDNSSLEYDNLSSTEDSIYFDYIKNDVTNTLTILNISIYNSEDELVKMLSDSTIRVFDSLNSGTIYKIVTTYSYNLNDGYGDRIDQVSQKYATIGEKILINSLELLNSNTPMVGDTMHIKVYYDNPNNLELIAIYINDEKKLISQQNVNEGFVVIPYNTYGLDEGYFDIVITGYSYKLIRNDEELEIKENLFQNYKQKVLLMGELNVTYFGFTSRLSYSVYNNASYTLTFDSSLGYEIEEVCINFLPFGERTITSANFNIVNDSEIEFKQFFDSTRFFDVTTIKYIKYSYNDSIAICYPSYTANLVYVSDDTVLQINEAEDFKNLVNGSVYEIVEDLDFKNMTEYIGGDFTGVILGNNHSIKNFNIIKNNASGYYGLFYEFSGYAENIIFENPYIVLEAIDNIDVCLFNLYGYGFLDNINVNNIYVEINTAKNITGDISAISRDMKLISNSTVSGDIIVNGSESGVMSSIFTVGILTYGKAINCVSKIDMTSTYAAAGICRSGKAINCENYGDISSARYSYGITWSGNVNKCINYGSMISNEEAGGIIGSYAYVYECINYGEITAVNATGIASEAMEIKNSINYGTIKGKENASGISVRNSYIINVINAGDIIGDIYCNIGSIVSYNYSESYISGAVCIGHSYSDTYEYMGPYSYVCHNSSYLTINEGTIFQAYDFLFHSEEDTKKDELTPIASLEMLNSKEFWISIGFSEDIFNLENLDYEAGIYPTLLFEKEIL
ncbi:MAG: hypothetical protein ACI35W_06790 [Anaeroplasmataceae bacterium]